ncbi:MAG: hypothetical protein ACFFEJ_05725 [Candidatus Thorarchaeota archaeon]
MPNSRMTQIAKQHRFKHIAFGALGICLFIVFFSYPVGAAAEITVSRGESFQIAATLLANGTFGEPVQYQIIEFFDQTYDVFIGTAITNELGIASIEYEFPITHPLGYTLVNVTYRGNETLSLAPSCQWISFLVTSFSYLELLPVQTNLAPDDNLVFSIRLSDDIQNPIENASLKIFCDSSLLTSTTTNSTGYATIVVNIENASIGIGAHTIEVIYEGNVTLFHRGSSNSFIIEVQKLSTSISPATEIIDTISLNQTASFSVKAVSEEGALSNVRLDLLIDGNLCYTTFTNSTGFAEYKIHFNESHSIGLHTLEIQYFGTQRYQETRLESEFVIETVAFLEAQVPTMVTINTTMSVTVILYDLFSRPIPYTTVYVIDKESNYSTFVETFWETEISLSFPIIGDIGNRTIQIIAENDYISSGKNTTLIVGVWSASRIQIISSNILGFASPNQVVRIQLQLSNQFGNLTDRMVSYSMPTMFGNSSLTTNQFGVATFEITVPDMEGIYRIHIYYDGSKYFFELSASQSFSIVVSNKIPVHISHFSYDVDHVFGSIHVRLQVQGLNGTNLGGILTHFLWNSKNFSAIAGVDGIVQMELPLPELSGLHSLFCHIPATNGIESYSCIFHIIITPIDMNSTEGVGMYPLILGLGSSLGIPIVPVLKRKSVTK